jgi:hypothetical protein
VSQCAVACIEGGPKTLFPQPASDEIETNDEFDIPAFLRKRGD